MAVPLAPATAFASGQGSAIAPRPSPPALSSVKPGRSTSTGSAGGSTFEQGSSTPTRDPAFRDPEPATATASRAQAADSPQAQTPDQTQDSLPGTEKAASPASPHPQNLDKAPPARSPAALPQVNLAQANLAQANLAPANQAAVGAAPAQAATTLQAPSATGSSGAPSPAPAHAAVATPPAGQVAQGLAALHLAGAGARQVTIHLTPGSLGSVQVQIARSADGAASITLLVQKPETLAALQQDGAHLHQALDRAGLPSAGRQISYQLAQTPADGGAFGSAANHNAGGGGAGDRHGRPAPEHQATGRTRDPGSEPAPAARPAAARRIHPAPAAGVNITA
jgi:hypothetical protein